MAIKELDIWPKAVLMTPLLVNGERPHVQEVIHATSPRHLFQNGANPELRR